MERFLEAYPAVLSVRQVAEILGCGDRCVRNLVNDHKLIGIKVGRLIRIPKDRLIDYLSAS